MTQDAWFAQLVQEYGAALMRVAAAYTHTAADREDLFQEIMFAIWRALATYRGEASLRTFAYRVAHNRGLTYRARERRPRLSLDEIPEPPEPRSDVAADLERGERAQRLRVALQTLSPLLRQVMVLQLEGLSSAEIAEVVGANENVIHVRAHRARAILRERLSPLRHT